MACQITHPTGKPGGLSLAVLRLDAEPVAYLTPSVSVDATAATTPFAETGSKIHSRLPKGSCWKSSRVPKICLYFWL